MKEFETDEIERALRHEREIEPSKFKALDQNHEQVKIVGEELVRLNGEWARLQAEQGEIIKGLHD